MRMIEVDSAVVSIYPQDLSLTWGSVAVMRAAARARIPRQTNTTVRQQVQASHGASIPSRTRAKQLWAWRERMGLVPTD